MQAFIGHHWLTNPSSSRQTATVKSDAAITPLPEVQVGKNVPTPSKTSPGTMVADTITLSPEAADIYQNGGMTGRYGFESVGGNKPLQFNDLPTWTPTYSDEATKIARTTRRVQAEQPEQILTATVGEIIPLTTEAQLDVVTATVGEVTPLTKEAQLDQVIDAKAGKNIPLSEVVRDVVLFPETISTLPSRDDFSRPRFTEEDLKSFQQAFGTSKNDKLYNARWDFDNDGHVSGADFGFFRTHYTDNIKRASFNEEDLKSFQQAFGSSQDDKRYNARWDFDNDGHVSGADFGFFRMHFAGSIQQPTFNEEDLKSFTQAFGTSNDNKSYNARWDFDGNGSISGADFGFFRAHFKGTV